MDSQPNSENQAAIYSIHNGAREKGSPFAPAFESPHPRRLAVDVLVDLEPTGEEVVRIRVRDSSTQPIEAEASTAAPTGVEHGLGIVRTALLRYDGSLEIAPGGDGYAKAVVVRLFRSQATHPEPLGEAA